MPVPGAEVWAEDEAGRRIARTAADGSGFFVLSGLPFGREPGKEDGEVAGAWFELRPGVEETAELGK